MKKYTTAISQFKQAKTVAKQCQDQAREIGVLQNMANAHIKMGQPKRRRLKTWRMLLPWQKIWEVRRIRGSY